ncbi:hypothetical protein AB4144_09470 [Rhizobiaceae sp. 2RAB30]
MKFSQTGLYIESYSKCANCGVLIYENSAEDAKKMRRHENRIFCSEECVDWMTAREARRAASAA